VKPRRRIPLLITLITIDVIAAVYMALDASVGAAYFRAVSTQLLAEADGDAMRDFLERSARQSANHQWIYILVLILNIVALAFVVDSDRRCAARERTDASGTERP